MNDGSCYGEKMVHIVLFGPSFNQSNDEKASPYQLSCNNIYPKPEAEGSGGCQGLTVRSITLNTGHDYFYYTESQSFTHLIYLRTLGPFKTQRLEA